MEGFDSEVPSTDSLLAICCQNLDICQVFIASVIKFLCIEIYILIFSCSFLDAKEGRYNPKMSPAITKGKWRKGSQVIHHNSFFLDLLLRLFFGFFS